MKVFVRTLLLMMAALAQSACDSREAITAPEAVTARASSADVGGGGDPSLYPDKLEAAQFEDVIWVQNAAQAWFTSSGQAKGAGQSEGFGNVASQRLSMKLYIGGHETGSTSASDEDFSDFWPKLFHIDDEITANTAIVCGMSSTAQVKSGVALRAFAGSSIGLVDLFRKTTTSSGNGYMNPCPPPSECDDPLTPAIEDCYPDEGGGGSGGGSDYEIIPSWTTQPPPSGSGTWVCETWFEFTSWDGGQTWYLTDTVVTSNCWEKME